MKKRDVLSAWGRILTGRYPTLSLEITRECPLKCPGCYAYEPEHLGPAGPLRSLADFKGTELIDGVMRLVDHYKPLHLSIVGGEPLVRYKELDVILPWLYSRGIEVQVVTSAVRTIPKQWAGQDLLHLVVSVDGLQADHDERRKPATYDRILENIDGHKVNIHCTATGQMTKRPGYFNEFLSFWSSRPEVKKVWISMFTPQKGATGPEVLSASDREDLIAEFAELRTTFPKLDLPDIVLNGFRNPPKSPAECIFARTTLNVTADLESKISPCQFGGDPDCAQCGCMASVGLKAVGDYKLLGFIPLKILYNASDRIGKTLIAATQGN